jgi:hypothetical protein
MNQRPTRSIPVVFLLLGVCAIGLAQTNDWSKRIVNKTRRPLASFINPHVSAINVLIIDGKRFERVRGLNQCYLQVPKTNFIVFVTEDDNYRVTYHVFNMDTDEDLALHSQSSRSPFGETIGSPSARDTVTVGDDGLIVLCNLDKSATSTLPSLADLDSVKQLIYLDPGKKAIVADKTFYYGKAGKVIYEFDASPPF